MEQITRTEEEIREVIANLKAREYCCSDKVEIANREQVLMVSELESPGSVDVNGLKDDSDVCAVLCVRDWLTGKRDERPDVGYGTSDDH